ncbi:MAG: 3-oxoacyl-ACP reductase FabG [Rickettsiales bacterium]|jgi:3-oxoacyl-[acyl-carrier protein] reductase|nr:3-oxoacyl-ACP reductase FabG [Rickettsiales bacterium]
MLNLEEQVALVTGASGGIGGSIARKLHSQGAHVIISGTNMTSLEKLASELKTRVTIETCNLHDDEAVSGLVDKAFAVHNKLDILVCNAGITKDNLSLRMSVEDFDEVIKINLRSSFILNKAAIKKMVRQKSGKIINISSIVGTTGNPGQANYTAAKAGMVAMSKSLALEVAARGVTVNCVAPGFIATAMTDKLSDDMKGELLKKVPCGRLGSPDDIANGVVFLASNEANYVTGQTLHINGGMAMI